VLAALAVHWFNPAVFLMAKAIAALCEKSCDAEVMNGADMETRRLYGEIIINAAKQPLYFKTALSTNFYCSKKGILNRISSLMDVRSKKAGVPLVAGIIAITLGTAFMFQARVLAEDTLEQEQAQTLTAAQVNFLLNGIRSYGYDGKIYTDYMQMYNDLFEDFEKARIVGLLDTDESFFSRSYDYGGKTITIGIFTKKPGTRT
jgi:hypothetical protein